VGIGSRKITLVDVGDSIRTNPADAFAAGTRLANIAEALSA
jgi:hypothetical protein